MPQIRKAVPEPPGHVSERGRSLRQDALAWAMANRSEDGQLPSGKAIGDQFGRHERWGRLVKQHGDNAEAVNGTRSAAV